MSGSDTPDGLAEAGQAAGWPAATLDVLRGGVTTQAARVMVVPGGPYLASGAMRITDHLGRPIEHDTVTALCRCGRSESKPRCDAACIRTGFDDAKAPDRVPDRRDTYAGQQVTVFDNRGLCQHSGLCTERLPGVFHTGSEPFVTPSGGRMDEIVRAVRDCPSGALSFAVDGVEARAQTDWAGTRPPTALISQDGPYRLTGGVEIVDGAGAPVPRAQGASTEHAALCRCGHSRNKPFCSGMHYYAGFRDPLPDPAAVPSIFEWAGGLPALERLTRLFYEKYVPADALLSPLFASMSPDHPQRVASWLGEVFGGPKAYSDRYGGYSYMLSQHVGKGIDEKRRARWAALLMRAADDAGLPTDAEFRSLFASYIDWGSRLAVDNSQADSRPSENMPMPHWDWTTAAGPPGSRVPARPGTNEPAQADPPVVLPAEDEPVSFSTHIRTLFRDRDRRSMLFAFDLWNRDDVATHAAAILARLQNGTMPCDGAWPERHIAVFARWIDEGTHP
ncbi:MAG TPA: CDGSH iron-sulfur domain-containing protein [Streptosporangiaceae bacterium]